MKTKTSGARAGAKKRNGKTSVFVEKSLENEGFSGYAVQGERRESDTPAPPEIAPAAWMTPALVEKTHAHWSRRYGRSLEQHEVVEILNNVRRFGELMRRAMNGGK